MSSSSNSASSSSTNSYTELSLYIPTIKNSYSIDRVMRLFWKHGLGKVDRIDFVPIMKTFKDSEPKACPYFKRAFLYIDPRSTWHPDIIKSIEEEKPYKIYPNKYEQFEHLRDENEFWMILKNNSPVPYSTTTLNVHQLANNLALLERQIAELQGENDSLKELIRNITESVETDKIKDKNDDSDDNDSDYDDGYEEFSFSDRFHNYDNEDEDDYQ